MELKPGDEIAIGALIIGLLITCLVMALRNVAAS
jgi:hypothetical protein